MLLSTFPLSQNWEMCLFVRVDTLLVQNFQCAASLCKLLLIYCSGCHQSFFNEESLHKWNQSYSAEAAEGWEGEKMLQHLPIELATIPIELLLKENKLQRNFPTFVRKRRKLGHDPRILLCVPQGMMNLNLTKLFSWHMLANLVGMNL